MSDNIVEKVLETAKDTDEGKRINCVQAFGLAKELNVSLKRIGDICNEQDIKIHNCQLGCFE